MLLQALPDPFLLAADGLHDEALCHQRPGMLFERDTGLRRFGDGFIEVAIALVAYHQPVVGAVKGEVFGKSLDGGGQAADVALRPFAVGHVLDGAGDTRRPSLGARAPSAPPVYEQCGTIGADDTVFDGIGFFPLHAFLDRLLDHCPVLGVDPVEKALQGGADRPRF